MVKIRLARAGRKKRPFYRILVTDSRSPRDSNFIEKLGYYDPLPKQQIVKLDWQKALSWLEKGAQPTDTARAILSNQGVMQLYEMKMHQNATPEQLDAALKAWMAKYPDRFATTAEIEKSE